MAPGAMLLNGIYVIFDLFRFVSGKPTRRVHALTMYKVTVVLEVKY